MFLTQFQQGWQHAYLSRLGLSGFASIYKYVLCRSFMRPILYLTEFPIFQPPEKSSASGGELHVFAGMTNIPEAAEKIGNPAKCKSGRTKNRANAPEFSCEAWQFFSGGSLRQGPYIAKTLRYRLQKALVPTARFATAGCLHLLV